MLNDKILATLRKLADDYDLGVTTWEYHVGYFLAVRDILGAKAECEARAYFDEVTAALLEKYGPHGHRPD